jgi:hypothetical protein
MDTPRLHGYPFDHEVVARVRARQRAREIERRAGRPETGFRAFLQWLVA